MNFSISCKDSASRLLSVDARGKIQPGKVEFRIRSPSGVTSFGAYDKRGFSLDWKRISEDCWEVVTVDGFINLSYTLHCYIMSPKESYVSDDTWIINPSTTFFESEATKTVEHIVVVNCEKAIYCNKPVEEDIEGKLIRFKTFDELKESFICCGEVRSIVKPDRDSSRGAPLDRGDLVILLKGDISDKSVESLDKRLDALTPYVQRQLSFFVFVVPKDIEQRALEFGVNSSGLIIVQNSNAHGSNFDTELYYSISRAIVASNFSVEEPRALFIKTGYSAYISYKCLDSELKNVKLLEQFLLRTFSVKHSVVDNLLDASARSPDYIARDRGFVVFLLLDLLGSQSSECAARSPRVEGSTDVRTQSSECAARLKEIKEDKSFANLLYKVKTYQDFVELIESFNKWILPLTVESENLEALYILLRVNLKEKGLILTRSKKGLISLSYRL
jgi:hypothetical protein